MKMYRDFQRTESQSRMHVEAPRLQPDEAAALTLIHYMSTTELTEYSNDDQKLDSLINDLHQVRNSRKSAKKKKKKNGAKEKCVQYSRLSLSRFPRDSLKYFVISVLRHI